MRVICTIASIWPLGYIMTYPWRIVSGVACSPFQGDHAAEMSARTVAELQAAALVSCFVTFVKSHWILSIAASVWATGTWGRDLQRGSVCTEMLTVVLVYPHVAWMEYEMYCSWPNGYLFNCGNTYLILLICFPRFPRPIGNQRLVKWCSNLGS